MKRWTIWSWTVAFLPILAMLMLMIIAGIASADYSGRPIWMRIGYTTHVSFDGCFTDPINPNPIESRIPRITISAASNETTVVVAASINRILGSSCTDATATDITSVKDSNNFIFTRLGGAAITFQGGVYAFEAWTSPPGGTGSASSEVTVTYAAGHYYNTVSANVYRQVSFLNFLPPVGNSSTSGFMVWSRNFNSTRQILSANLAVLQPSSCNGYQPACAYPANGAAHGGAGPNDEPNIDIPCREPTDPSKHCSDFPEAGGYRYDNSFILSRWYSFQVNISTTGDRRFGAETTSPDSTGEILVGVFLTGPSIIPPPDPGIAIVDIATSAFWLLIFGVIISLMVIGAYKIRTWGE